jgi:hypothetical protein
MKVADEIPGIVIDHDASIEGVETRRAIVPFLGFLVQVTRVEAAELVDGRRVLSRGGGHGGQSSHARQQKRGETGVSSMMSCKAA